MFSYYRVSSLTIEVEAWSVNARIIAVVTQDVLGNNTLWQENTFSMVIDAFCKREHILIHAFCKREHVL